MAWIVDFLADLYRSFRLDLGSEDLKERGDYSLVLQTILLQFQYFLYRNETKKAMT